MAHRLSSLHDAADTKVFDKVVVITDRRVLDRQLQDTIYQFEHAHGVVMRIDENSQQLADALAGEQARIIITTLQKFPFVTDKIESLPQRRYAVIVDEAHSSQTGDSAASMKAVLGAGQEPDPDEPAERGRGRAGCRGGGPGQAAEPVVLRLHRHPEGTDAGAVRPLRPGDRAARAVPPVLDAPGDPGGLHPRRARQLRHLPDVLAHRADDPRRPRVRPRQGARRRSPGSSPCTRTSWPRRPRSIVEHFRAKVAAQGRRSGQGDGRHPVP